MRTKIKAVTLIYVRSIPSLSNYIHINSLVLQLKNGSGSCHSF